MRIEKTLAESDYFQGMTGLEGCKSSLSLLYGPKRRWRVFNALRPCHQKFAFQVKKSDEFFGVIIFVTKRHYPLFSAHVSIMDRVTWVHLLSSQHSGCTCGSLEPHPALTRYTAFGKVISPPTDSGIFKWKNTCLPYWWCGRRWDVKVKGIMEMRLSGPRLSPPDLQGPRGTSQLLSCPRSCKYWLKVRKDPSSSDIPPRSLLGSLFTNWICSPVFSAKDP